MFSLANLVMEESGKVLLQSKKFKQYDLMFVTLLFRLSCPYDRRPTKRAPDGWWAPRFELDSSERFDSVSLVGSPSRR
jgi:hypothetical protein